MSGAREVLLQEPAAVKRLPAFADRILMFDRIREDIRSVMERDPEGAVLAYRQILRGIISMPGRLMYDGEDTDLYDHFATVTQHIGVYTVRDYAGIIAHLNEAWGIGHRSLSGKGAKAQDYLCRQPER